MSNDKVLVNEVLDEMVDIAQKKGIDLGVAFVLIWEDDDEHPRIVFKVNGDFERDPDPEEEGDTGVSYFAVVMAKLAVMISLLRNSGPPERPLKFGEVEYLGGLYMRMPDMNVFVGYSGAPEEVDVEISWHGMGMLYA